MSDTRFSSLRLSLQRLALVILPALNITVSAEAIEFGPVAPISNAIRNPALLSKYDLNSDGASDLFAVSDDGNAYHHKVSWWINDGRGGFSPGGQWRPPGDRDVIHALMNLNHDGKPVLLVRHYPAEGGDLEFHLYGWSGAGFDNHLGVLPFPADPKAVVEDLNGDLVPDLLTPEGTYLGAPNGIFTLLPGDTSPSPAFTAASEASQRIWADVTGDGRVDLLTTNGRNSIFVTPSLPSGRSGRFGQTVPLLSLEDADGVIRAAAVVSLPALSADPCIVVAESSFATPTMVTQLGLWIKRDGSYQRGGVLDLTLRDAIQVHSMQVSKNEADGSLRVLAEVLHAPGNRLPKGPRYSALTEVLIRAGAGGKPMLSLRELQRHDGYVDEFFLAEMNQRGTQDLVMARLQTNVSPGTFDQIRVYPGQSNSTFPATKFEAVTDAPLATSLKFTGDLNGDGAPDLLTQNDYNSSAIIAWINSGHGESLKPQTIFSRGESSWIVDVRDRTGDGLPDPLVVSISHPYSKSSTSELVLLVALPNGRYQQRILMRDRHQWLSASLGDADSDGLDDIAVQVLVPGNHSPQGPQVDDSTRIQWIRALSSMRFTTNLRPDANRFPDYSFVTVDVNGDGWDDRVIPGMWQEGPFFQDAHPLPDGAELQDSDGTFTIGSLRPAGVDFDNNGVNDWISTSFLGVTPLLAQVHHSSTIGSLYPLESEAGQVVTFPYAGTTDSTLFADLDGDHLVDVVYYDAELGSWAWRRNTGSLIWSEPEVIRTAVQSGKHFSIADLNLDGIPDLISIDSDGTVEWLPGGNPQ